MYKQSRFNSVRKIGEKIIIYNSLTKAFLNVYDSSVIECAVKELNNQEKKEEQYLDLIQNGFIIKEEKDEIAELQYIFNKSYFNRDTLSIALVPSMACNFACPYCFEEPYRDTGVNPVYFTTLKKYAEKNFKFYKHIDINMFGGEPLLFFDDMLDYLEYISELSKKYDFYYTCSIITNGSLLTPKIMEALKKHKCNSIQITLDGCRRTHDSTRKFKDGRASFDHLIHIMNDIVGPYLKLWNYNFTLRFNLLNTELEEVKESLCLISPEYRKYISVFFRKIYDTSCFEGNNNNTENDYFELLSYAETMGFNIMYNQYFARSCEACSDADFGYITSDLSFWKCINSKDSNDERGKIGKILEDGTMKLDSEKLVNWYKAANCFGDKKCLNCSQLPDCLGGCIAYCVADGCKHRLCSEFNLTSLPFLYKKQIDEK